MRHPIPDAGAFSACLPFPGQPLPGAMQGAGPQTLGVGSDAGVLALAYGVPVGGGSGFAFSAADQALLAALPNQALLAPGMPDQASCGAQAGGDGSSAARPPGGEVPWPVSAPPVLVLIKCHVAFLGGAVADGRVPHWASLRLCRACAYVYIEV